MGKRPRAKGPRSTQKRAEILRTAAAAFSRHGYHGASVEQIARTLGMTKGSLYYYFENKEEILFFCHDYSLDILIELLERIDRGSDATDQKVHSLVVGFVHMLLDELQGTELTHDIGALSPRLFRRVTAKRDRFENGVRRLVQQGMDEGVFAKGDAKLVSFAILGAMNWITRWFSPTGSASSQQIAEQFAGFLLAGLRRGNPPSSAGSPS